MHKHIQTGTDVIITWCSTSTDEDLINIKYQYIKDGEK